MEPTNRKKWITRAGAALAVALGIGFVVGTWSYAGVLRDELVAIDHNEPVRGTEIVTVGSGRIVTARTPVTEAEGIWGVRGPNGYGQASVLVSANDQVVERAFRILDGTFEVGELVSFDHVAYPGDPLTAHGIDFDEVRFTGDLGVYPAWVVAGNRDSWMIIVHGAGPAERAEALRIIPGLVAEGYPVMVVTVRGDLGAPPTRNGLRSLGAKEWRDLAAAVDFGFAQDAEEFFLLGFDAGASTVAMYLHDADDISHVKGAIFDSAFYDPERIADRLANERRVLMPMRGTGKLLARLRFDVDWEELDQIERAEEYTVPILVLHGTADQVVDVEVALEFATALGDLATYEEFPGGQHSQLWNSDPARYEATLLGFLERVRTAE
ncbi:MAG: prolyl oligopeptidase family serine peptidase [bacterium]|nr:prolyl oligopeptidase family serine peptidase [bacterium]